MIPGIGIIFLMQTITGGPIYMLAGVLQGIFLHYHGYSAVAAVATALLTTALTICASVLIWSQLTVGVPIMWGAVNLPALVASVILYPLVTLVIAVGFIKRKGH